MTQEDRIASPSGPSGDPNQKTITRADLAEAVHLATRLGRTDAAKYVEMVLDEIFQAIASREDVKLSSFGAFIVRAKRERQGRNPKTGEGARITARLVVTFKPSNVLRARVNGGNGAVEEDEPAKPNGALKGDGALRGNGAGKSRGNGKAK